MDAGAVRVLCPQVSPLALLAPAVTGQEKCTEPTEHSEAVFYEAA